MRKLIRRALALPACPLLATGAVLVTTLALVDPGSTPAMRPGDCVAVMRPAGLKSAGQAQIWKLAPTRVLTSAVRSPIR